MNFKHKEEYTRLVQTSQGKIDTLPEGLDLLPVKQLLKPNLLVNQRLPLCRRGLDPLVDQPLKPIPDLALAHSRMCTSYAWAQSLM